MSGFIPLAKAACESHCSLTSSTFMPIYFDAPCKYCHSGRRATTRRLPKCLQTRITTSLRTASGEFQGWQKERSALSLKRHATKRECPSASLPPQSVSRRATSRTLRTGTAKSQSRRAHSPAFYQQTVKLCFREFKV